MKKTIFRDSRCLFIIDKWHDIQSGTLLEQVDLPEDHVIETPKTKMDQSQTCSP